MDPDPHPDPNSWGPYVFGPSGSASRSFSHKCRLRILPSSRMTFYQCSGSGSVSKCHGSTTLVCAKKDNVKRTVALDLLHPTDVLPLLIGPNYLKLNVPEHRIQVAGVLRYRSYRTVNPSSRKKRQSGIDTILCHSNKAVSGIEI